MSNKVTLNGFVNIQAELSKVQGKTFCTCMEHGVAPASIGAALKASTAAHQEAADILAVMGQDVEAPVKETAAKAAKTIAVNRYVAHAINHASAVPVAANDGQRAGKGA